MSLRTKMLIANGAVLVGVLVLVGACMWGLRMQRQHVDASLQEYTAIKSVKAAQLSVIAARAGLQARPPDNARVIGDLQDALQSLRGYNSTLTSYAPEIPADVGQAPVQLARDETVAAVAHVNNLLDILSVHNQAAAGAGVSGYMYLTRSVFVQP